MALVSIVIPCYNHGRFLLEALRSIEEAAIKVPYEVVIVDDGSTDRETQAIVNAVDTSKYNVVRQDNRGLGAARNAGIAGATGDYILPLDSDNLLSPGFIETALCLFEEKGVDIVYPDASVFGDKAEEVLVPDFDIGKMLECNYIDACALFKKKVWEVLGGYKTDMPFMGHEDWEFWINAYYHGFRFLHLPVIGFRYRYRADSMLRSINDGRRKANTEYIFRVHAGKLASFFVDALEEIKHNQYLLSYIKAYCRKHPLRAIVKILLKKDLV